MVNAVSPPADLVLARQGDGLLLTWRPMADGLDSGLNAVEVWGSVQEDQATARLLVVARCPWLADPTQGSAVLVACSPGPLCVWLRTVHWSGEVSDFVQGRG